MTRTNTKTEQPPLRFAGSTRGHTTSRLLDPLPTEVAKAAPAEAKKHRDVAKRYSEFAAARRRLVGELEQARLADDEARVDAISKGEKLPEPTAPEIEAKLAEAEKIEAAAELAVQRSASELLNAVEPKLAEVGEKLAAELDDEAAAIRADLEAAKARFAGLAGLDAARGWISSVRFGNRSAVPTFAPGGVSGQFSREQTLVGQTIESFDETLRRREEQAREAAAWRQGEQAGRERQAAGRETPTK
jgi:hypothetical protein